MQKDISPEEKLLSIIKKKQKSPDDVVNGKAEGREKKIGNPSARNKIDDYILMILKNSFLKNILFVPEILKVFNKYMVIIVTLLMLYFIFDIIFIRPSRDAASIISRVSVSKAPMPLEKKAPIETKNYSHYSNKIAGKNIFSGSSYGPGEGQEGLGASGDASVSNLGLVGIVPGDNPQAIIEDKKNQKTYYLIKGQSVDEIMVEDVSEGKAILEYKGKKATLFL